MDIHPHNTTAAAAGMSRRQMILTALTGGVVLATPALLGTQVLAADSSSTTTPPKRSADDAAGLNAALVAERGHVQVYAAMEKVTLRDNERTVVVAMREHHQAYVDALKGYVGSSAATDAGTASITPSGDFASMLPALVDLEKAAAAAHTDALRVIKGTDAAALVASIITVEAHHSAALAMLAELPLDVVTAG
ncbi:MAG: Ferritin-like domain [Actinomycetota bacterium]